MLLNDMPSVDNSSINRKKSKSSSLPLAITKWQQNKKRQEMNRITFVVANLKKNTLILEHVTVTQNICWR